MVHPGRPLCPQCDQLDALLPPAHPPHQRDSIPGNLREEGSVVAVVVVITAVVVVPIFACSQNPSTLYHYVFSFTLTRCLTAFKTHIEQCNLSFQYLLSSFFLPSKPNQATSSHFNRFLKSMLTCLLKLN